MSQVYGIGLRHRQSRTKEEAQREVHAVHLSRQDGSTDG